MGRGASISSELIPSWSDHNIFVPIHYFNIPYLNIIIPLVKCRYSILRKKHFYEFYAIVALWNRRQVSARKSIKWLWRKSCRNNKTLFKNLYKFIQIYKCQNTTVHYTLPTIQWYCILYKNVYPRYSTVYQC